MRIDKLFALFFAVFFFGPWAGAAGSISDPDAYYTLQEDGGYTLSIKLVADQQESQTQEKLSGNLTEFLNFERFLNDRANHKDFDSIKEKQVPAAARPESGIVLKLWSVEVPISELAIFGDRQVPLPEQLLVKKNGKEYFKFLIHPFSYFLYKERFKKYQWSLDYLAVPTASYRSMIAWRPETPNDPLYVKLSFDVKLGGFTRHLFLSDVQKSPTVTEIMKNLTPKVKESFQFDYIPETHALIPTGMKSGGMIVRDIEPIKKHTAIPLFALFSKKFKKLDKTNSEKQTFLGAMMAISALKPQAFVEENFIRPLIRMALFFRFILGMNSQLHEQNVLFCYDCFVNGRPQFLVRDSEQFYMDFEGQLTFDENANPHLPYFLKKPVIPRSFVAMGAEESIGEFNSYIRDSTLFALQKGLSADYPEITAKWMRATFSEVLRQEMEAFVHLKPRDLSHAKKLTKEYFSLLSPPVKPPCVDLLM